MGSSTFTRIATAVGTMYYSELVQKKPFQNFGKSDVQRNPLGIKGLGPALADPVHAVGKSFSGIMPKPKTPGEVAPVTVAEQAVQQSVSDAAARRSKSRGFRSTILSQNFLSADNPALKNTFGA